jgi:hypothetical protein
MEKINIAEILKDCPQGMELDCTMWDNLYFDRVEDDLIHCYYELDGYRNTTMFLKDGCYTAHKLSKCVIFPKGKTTWEGFHRPFKDGDILTTNDGACVAIVKKNGGKCYCCCYTQVTYFVTDYIGWFDRFATEEEKAKLFKAIKDNGYRWNPETKTLEKLIEPIFEVGNKIEKCGYRFTIAEVKDDYYLTKCGNKIPIDNQDDFSLVPNKFDISTLIPFESRVLVRDVSCYEWEADIFGRYSDGYITLGGAIWKQCIPYKGNEHLLGTRNDCDDFYKTWKDDGTKI